jgi:hypothetical protein
LIASAGQITSLSDATLTREALEDVGSYISARDRLAAAEMRVRPWASYYHAQGPHRAHIVIDHRHHDVESEINHRPRAFASLTMTIIPTAGG